MEGVIEIEINTKIKYIQENIRSVDNHKTLVDYFINNNINFTENNNGIFINLSVLQEPVIDFIYFFINNKTDLIPHSFERYYEKNEEYIPPDKNINIVDILIKDLPQTFHDVIHYSKQEKL